MHLTKKKSETKAQSAPKPVSKPVENPVSDVLVKSEHNSGDGVLVVARSSMVVEAELETVSETSPVSDAPVSPTPSIAARSSEADAQTKKVLAPSHSIKSVPIFGSLIEWIIAIPAGFFIVVIIPRLFGFGFHASDFVDVITTQGLGRYTIVIQLVLFWSIATVVCVSALNIVLRKFLDARKMRKVPA